MRVRGQFRYEARQQTRSGLDQHHAGFARVDVAKFVRQSHVCELGDGAREFDARRAAADDDEGEQRAATRRIGLALGALEGQQDAPPDGGCVLQRFEPRRVRLPFVVAEIGVPRPRRQHQRVVAQRAAVRRAARGDSRVSTPVTAASKVVTSLRLRSKLADRPGDFRSGQRRGAHLVEQRLEQMMIALIDDGDAHVGAGQVLAPRRGRRSRRRRSPRGAAAPRSRCAFGRAATVAPRSPPRSRHRARRTAGAPSVKP